MCKAGVELAFEVMVEAGIKEESAYYESLHETPLIANTIARKKLYEMNVVISDTAEYGCYLFDHACRPLLAASCISPCSMRQALCFFLQRTTDNGPLTMLLPVAL